MAACANSGGGSGSVPTASDSASAQWPDAHADASQEPSNNPQASSPDNAPEQAPEPSDSIGDGSPAPEDAEGQSPELSEPSGDNSPAPSGTQSSKAEPSSSSAAPSKPEAPSSPVKEPRESGPSVKQPETVTVEIINFEFTPAEIEVTLGSKVKFINYDDVEHSAVADDGQFDTGMLAKDESMTVTFNEAGTFSYHCNPHTAMTGKIIVKS